MSNEMSQGQPKAEANGADVEALIAAEVQKMRTELEAREDVFKKELSGLNRRNTELEKIVADKEEAAKRAEMEKLSVAEQAKLESEKIREEWEKEKREKQLALNKNTAILMVEKEGLPSELVEYIDYGNADGLPESVLKLKEIISDQVTKALEEHNRKYGTGAPVGSSPVVPPKSFREAKTKEERIAYLKAQGQK